MKKNIYTLLLLLFSTVTIAQLTEITLNDIDPTSIRPMFQYQGNLYTHSYNMTNQQWGQYKINPDAQTVTQLNAITEEGQNPSTEWLLAYCGTDCIYHSGGFLPNYYNNDVYLHKGALKLNTQNNNITYNEDFSSWTGFLFGNRFYLTSLNHYKDLATNTIVGEFQQPTPSWFLYHNFHFINNGKMIIPVGILNTEESDYTYHILRIDSNYETLQNLDLTGFSSNISTFDLYDKNPVFANNRLFYLGGYESGNFNKIISVDVNNLENHNFNILSFDENQGANFDYILLNDGVIFLHKQYNNETAQYTYHWYKTDGISNAVEIDYMPNTGVSGSGSFNLNRWFKTYSETNDYYPSAYGNDGGPNGWIGNGFVTIGNTTYFSTVNPDTIECKLWKMTSINSAPELIHTYSGSMLTSRNSIFYATEWQGNLIFLNGEDGLIYRYNGLELTVDPDLNILNPNGRSMNEMQVYGIIPFENNIIITTNEGAYSIYGGTLSVSEQELSKLKIYPNPVNETLNFSEELSDVQLFDITRRTIKSFTGANEKIDISDLSKGTYIIKGTTEAGKRFVEKIIKN